MIHQPLVARGRTIGVLQLLGKEERAYTNAEQHLACGIAEQVAATIHDTRLLAELMRHNLELEGRAEQLRSDVDRREHQLQGIRGAIAAAERIKTTHAWPRIAELYLERIRHLTSG